MVVPATAYQAVHSPSAVAHPYPIGRELVVESRVFTQENQIGENKIYGVTSYSFPTVSLGEENIDSVFGDNNRGVLPLQNAIKHLLYASYYPDQELAIHNWVNTSEIPDFVRSAAEVVSGELSEQSLPREELVYYWVQINPWVILVIRVAGIVFLAPFVNSLYDEINRRIVDNIVDIVMPWLGNP